MEASNCDIRFSFPFGAVSRAPCASAQARTTASTRPDSDPRSRPWSTSRLRWRPPSDWDPPTPRISSARWSRSAGQGEERSQRASQPHSASCLLLIWLRPASLVRLALPFPSSVLQQGRLRVADRRLLRQRKRISDRTADGEVRATACTHRRALECAHSEPAASRGECSRRSLRGATLPPHWLRSLTVRGGQVFVQVRHACRRSRAGATQRPRRAPLRLEWRCHSSLSVCARLLLLPARAISISRNTGGQSPAARPWPAARRGECAPLTQRHMHPI